MHLSLPAWRAAISSFGAVMVCVIGGSCRDVLGVDGRAITRTRRRWGGEPISSSSSSSSSSTMSANLRIPLCRNAIKLNRFLDTSNHERMCFFFFKGRREKLNLTVVVRRTQRINWLAIMTRTKAELLNRMSWKFQFSTRSIKIH